MRPEATDSVSRTKTRQGTVVSDRMNKTVVVSVERASLHPLYKKVVRVRRKFFAHDESNECRAGDRVRIAECRPLSKNKRWRIVEVVEKAPGV